MDMDNVKKIPRRYRRTVHLTIRVTPDIKHWLIEKELSPTAIFHEALKELGYEKGSYANIEYGREKSSWKGRGDIVGQKKRYNKKYRSKYKRRR